MSEIGRRSLFALGGATILAGGGTGAHGAEFNPAIPGVTIQVRYYRRIWEVLVPDWQNAENVPPIEGFLLPTRWIPLTDFLAVMDGSV